MNSKISLALTIAGSDSSGGAGIQADLKTFTSLGVYGQSVVTSITAQNTLGVTAIHDLPAEFVGSQIDSVFNDIGCDSLKIGMLSNRDIVTVVAEKIAQHRFKKVVLDTVLVSNSGAELLSPDAVAVFKKMLIPLSLVATPNVPEAEALTGLRINYEEDLKNAAEKFMELGCRYVFVKGGHLKNSEHATDFLYDGSEFLELRSERIDTENTHGTGCTLSAAICAYLAGGNEVEDAVKLAKEYTHGAIRNSLGIGKGQGPLNHFWNIKS